MPESAEPRHCRCFPNPDVETFAWARAPPRPGDFIALWPRNVASPSVGQHRPTSDSFRNTPLDSCVRAETKFHPLQPEHYWAVLPWIGLNRRSASSVSCRSASTRISPLRRAAILRAKPAEHADRSGWSTSAVDRLVPPATESPHPPFAGLPWHRLTVENQ